MTREQKKQRLKHLREVYLGNATIIEAELNVLIGSEVTATAMTWTGSLLIQADHPAVKLAALKEIQRLEEQV